MRSSPDGHNLKVGGARAIGPSVRKAVAHRSARNANRLELALTPPATKPAGPRIGLEAPVPPDAGARARARWPDPVLSAALIVAYLALEWLSFLHQHEGLPVTPWNPGHGMMLAAIILGGRGYGLAFFLGVFLAELTIVRTTLSWPTVGAMSAIIAGTYTTLATASATRPFLRHGPDAVLTRDTLKLFLTSLVGAALVAAMLWLLLLSIDHSDISDIARAAVPLVVGDLIGIMVFTPLLLRAYLFRDRLMGVTPRVLGELAALTLTVFALLVLTTWPGVHQQNLFYLLFLPVVVAAVRYGIDGACAALGLTELLLVGLLHYRGFDLSQFTQYQALMLVLTLTGLVVGALVSERRRADETARRASEHLDDLRAQAARAARLNLVGGMATALAHEVSQPITAARAHARAVQELLKAPEPDASRVRGNVAAMIEQIDHAGGVIAHMRDFLRRGAPRVASLDVSRLLSEALSLVAPVARAGQVEIRLDASADLAALRGDRIQLQQVVINLIRNAVEAIAESGSKGGRVHITALLSSEGREIEIAVRDNGPGIAPDRVATLFDPLATSRAEGIGLGLSICRTIVQAHGGRIWLACAEPGRTEFRFVLPTAATADAMA